MRGPTVGFQTSILSPVINPGSIESLGILNEAAAWLLSEHHVWRYNMNLQTNPERYGELITTAHSVEDKIKTIKYLQFALEHATEWIEPDIELETDDYHSEARFMNKKVNP